MQFSKSICTVYRNVRPYFNTDTISNSQQIGHNAPALNHYQRQSNLLMYATITMLPENKEVFDKQDIKYHVRKSSESASVITSSNVCFAKKLKLQSRRCRQDEPSQKRRKRRRNRHQIQASTTSRGSKMGSHSGQDLANFEVKYHNHGPTFKYLHIDAKSMFAQHESLPLEVGQTESSS